uniref:Uncharacterized protein n=1 Tax=Anguilla anguilla TaxID=7936 RepID=A0A0E9R4L7_ANGAN
MVKPKCIEVPLLRKAVCALKPHVNCLITNHYKSKIVEYRVLRNYVFVPNVKLTAYVCAFSGFYH